MQVQEFDIEKAEGLILMHALHMNDRRFPRGYQLSASDLLFLKSCGIQRITGIKLQPGDISADNALNTLAAKICGHNMAYTLPENGICKIVAADKGVFIASEERIAKFNRMSDQIILNTVPPYKNLKKGEVVGELSLPTPVIEKDLINDMSVRLSGNESLLALSGKTQQDAAIIYTRLGNESEENERYTAVVQKLLNNMAELGIVFTNEYNTPHTIENIADTIQSALRYHSLVFVIPALPTAHIQDTLPAALNSLVDDLICRGIAQNSGPDLLIATKRNAKIIGLPFNYGSETSLLADKLIKMAVTKETLTQADFAHPGTAWLGKAELDNEEKSRLVANMSSPAREPRIAAVILAAGTASRARCNKLMVDVDDAPLFMKTVTAALRSKASPIFVITGHQAEKIEKCLENIDVNVLYNYEYASGVKTSIRLGLRSVPSFCDGAILLPADMPNITADYLNMLIKSYNPAKKRQLLVTTDGIHKYNPVLWSRELYAEADLVPENADIREVFIEHADYTDYVNAPEGACFDVNFPHDIEIATGKAKA